MRAHCKAGPQESSRAPLRLLHVSVPVREQERPLPGRSPRHLHAVRRRRRGRREPSDPRTLRPHQVPHGVAPKPVPFRPVHMRGRQAAFLPVPQVRRGTIAPTLHECTYHCEHMPRECAYVRTGCPTELVLNVEHGYTVQLVGDTAFWADVQHPVPRLHQQVDQVKREADG